jgi:hypothetical protein
MTLRQAQGGYSNPNSNGRAEGAWAEGRASVLLLILLLLLLLFILLLFILLLLFWERVRAGERRIKIRIKSRKRIKSRRKIKSRTGGRNVLTGAGACC